MRADVRRYGVEEARTPADVDRLIAPEQGTVLMVVNSVCGCAAGRARPAVGIAMQHGVRPAKAASVFAGGDEAAVAHLRAIMADYPPSSPSIAFFKDNELVHMVERHQIEGRPAELIARHLEQVYDHFCESPVVNSEVK